MLQTLPANASAATVFIRKPVSANGVTVAVCPLCGINIAFSRLEWALDIAERAHICQGKKPPESVLRP